MFIIIFFLIKTTVIDLYFPQPPHEVNTSITSLEMRKQEQIV